MQSKVNALINLIQEVTNIPDLKVISRKREITTARNIFFHLLRTYTRLSYEDIGSYMDKNHATVMHSVSTMNDLLHTDKQTKQLYCIIENQARRIFEGEPLTVDIHQEFNFLKQRGYITPEFEKAIRTILRKNESMKRILKLRNEKTINPTFTV